MGSARRARRGARRARISGCAALRRYDHRPPCVHGGCAPLPRRYDTARKSMPDLRRSRIVRDRPGGFDWSRARAHLFSHCTDSFRRHALPARYWRTRLSLNAHRAWPSIQRRSIFRLAVAAAPEYGAGCACARARRICANISFNHHRGPYRCRRACAEQSVHFDTDITRPEFSWVRGLNAFLPDSVAVQWAHAVPDAFHARFSAVERCYDYVLYIHRVRVPLLAGRAGWIHAPLDIDAMRVAARALIGIHDFSGFRSSECQAKSPVKHLYALDIDMRGAFIFFRFRANAFLHHMVRNMMGCLLAIGRGRQPAGWMRAVLEARDRCNAAPTFMPDGLYLTRIRYPDEFDLPSSAHFTLF